MCVYNMNTGHRRNVPMFAWWAGCIAAFAILLSHPLRAADQRCPAEPPVFRYDIRSTVHGKPFPRTVFGPPGYGENPATDPKITIIVLKLDCPITVKPDAAARFPETSNLSELHDIGEIQLFFSNREQREAAMRHIGEPLLLGGKLEEAVAGGEYTRITMDVEEIRSTGNAKRQD